MFEMMDGCLTEASGIFDINLKKVNVVTEAARREYEINCMEAELKIMNENGTDDDLAFYYKEAENGLIDTVIKGIAKIKDAIVKFFSEIKSKIMVYITKAESTEALTKVSKKVKIFPLIGRKKMLMEDYNEETKIANEHIAKLSKLKAKANGNQEVSVEDVEEVKKSFLEKHGKKIGVAGAVTVTVIAALKFVETMTKKASGTCNSLEKESKKWCDDAKKIAENVNNPAVATAFARTATTIYKTNQEDFIRCWRDSIKNIIQAAKAFGKGKANGADVADIVGESTDTDGGLNAESMKDIASAVSDPSTSNSSSSSNSTDEIKEDGCEDPIADVPAIASDEPSETSDVWDDVIAAAGADDDLDDVDDVDECGANNCATESTSGEIEEINVEESSDDNDVADEPVAEGTDNSDVFPKDKTSVDVPLNQKTDTNDWMEGKKSIDQLFDEIFSDVSAETCQPTEAQQYKESSDDENASEPTEGKPVAESENTDNTDDAVVNEHTTSAYESLMNEINDLTFR